MGDEGRCVYLGCNEFKASSVHDPSKMGRVQNWHAFMEAEERMAPPPERSFLEDFKREHEAAGKIVLSRDKEGRNASVSVKDQFETTTSTASEFVLEIIEMKLKRAQSYLAAGNFDKFQEELHDVSNYALFAVVFETPPPIPEGGFGKVFDRGKTQLSGTDMGSGSSTL